MNINQIGKLGAISQYNKLATTPKAVNTKKVQESDSFVMSDDSKVFADAHSTLRKMLQSENINAANVSRIKSDIENGVYNIKTSQVVDKMVEQV